VTCHEGGCGVCVVNGLYSDPLSNEQKSISINSVSLIHRLKEKSTNDTQIKYSSACFHFIRVTIGNLQQSKESVAGQQNCIQSKKDLPIRMAVNVAIARLVLL
jgi:hypothetical protein